MGWMAASDPLEQVQSHMQFKTPEEAIAVAERNGAFSSRFIVARLNPLGA